MASQTNIVAKAGPPHGWAEQIRDCGTVKNERGSLMPPSMALQKQTVIPSQTCSETCLDPALADTGGAVRLYQKSCPRNPEDVALRSNPGCSTTTPVACIIGMSGLSAKSFRTFPQRLPAALWRLSAMLDNARVSQFKKKYICTRIYRPAPRGSMGSQRLCASSFPGPI